jgi:hypothetical protein
MLKQLLLRLLRSKFGKLVIEFLISEFISWIESKGFRVMGPFTASKSWSSETFLSPTELVREFVKTQTERVFTEVVKK